MATDHPLDEGRVIRLHAHDPSILSADEFKEILDDLTSRAVARDVQPGDRVLAKMLHNNLWRYNEIMRRRTALQELAKEGA